MKYSTGIMSFLDLLKDLQARYPTASLGLFDTVAEDVLQFGIGSAFNAKKVSDLLSLKRGDVSRITSVSVKSARYDHAIPVQMKERLEEIANTINIVAKVFGGDIEKTSAWFRARNPLLGDASPRDMIRMADMNLYESSSSMLCPITSIKL